MPKSKLRFALVTTFPPGTGSLNEYAYHFVRVLQQKNEISEIILLVDKLPEGEEYTPQNFPILGVNVRLEVVPCWEFNSWANSWGILKTLFKLKPDVVLFNIQFASFGSRKIPAALGLLAPALCRAAGYPTIVLLHNIMETIDLKSAGFKHSRLMEKAVRFFGNLVTRLILRANLVAVTIPKYVDTLSRKYGAINVILAPHGSFHEVPRSKVGPAAGPTQIMTFGKFGTYKKIEPLLEAFQLLQKANLGPLELVIAGTDSPNAPGYLEEIRRRYEGLSGVRYTGYVPEEEVPGLFRAATVVVFPYSHTTGSSGVLHQAGEHGKAVVLPDIGDLAELIAEEGYAGQFFEPENAVSLSQSIGELLRDPQQRQAIAEQNYTAALGLPISDVADWYLLHFEDLLNHSKPQSKKPVWRKLLIWN